MGAGRVNPNVREPLVSGDEEPTLGLHRLPQQRIFYAAHPLVRYSQDPMPEVPEQLSHLKREVLIHLNIERHWLTRNRENNLSPEHVRRIRQGRPNVFDR